MECVCCYVRYTVPLKYEEESVSDASGMLEATLPYIIIVMFDVIIRSYKW